MVVSTLAPRAGPESVQLIFHHRVGQIEPLPQKISEQHPLQTYRRPPVDIRANTARSTHTAQPRALPVLSRRKAPSASSWSLVYRSNPFIVASVLCFISSPIWIRCWKKEPISSLAVRICFLILAESARLSRSHSRGAMQRPIGEVANLLAV